MGYPGHVRMFWVMAIFYISIVVMATGLYMFIKTQDLPMKRVNFTQCKLSLNLD